jgi:hypothetical protein
MNWKRGDKLAEVISSQFPKTFKAAYPRHIQTPAGYADPRIYAATLFGHLKACESFGLLELAHKTAYGIAVTLINHRVPTYFVADEFAQAVANTDLPGDFKFEELKWPLDAQVFVLSDKFSMSYFGTYAPFLSVCRLNPGKYPEDFPRPMPVVESPYMSFIIPGSRILFDYPHFGSSTPVTYNGSYPMSEGLDTAQNAPWNDATVFERAFHGVGPMLKGELVGEQEEKFILQARHLIVKLLLAVANRPSLVEHGRVTRHAVVTPQGKVKLPELVSPNVIGRTYRISRRHSTEGSSAGRSAPRFKYRRGHFTWQAKRFKNVEFVSVDEMPRRADGFIDFDAAGEKADKFRACHERIWIEGFFFDEDEGRE